VLEKNMSSTPHPHRTNSGIALSRPTHHYIAITWQVSHGEYMHERSLGRARLPSLTGALLGVLVITTCFGGADYSLFITTLILI
jgi:hypothetical protein